MPSRLGIANPTKLFYKKQATKRLAPNDLQVLGPWKGYEPNLRGSGMSWNGFRDVSGLIPVGDYLQNDDGFQWVDNNSASTYKLPLGSGALPSSNAQAVTGIAEYVYTNVPATAPYVIAVTAYGGAAAGRFFYRANATANWTALALEGGETAPDKLGDSDNTRLYDWCYFSPGAPGRATVGAAITSPILVFCNGYDDPAGTRVAGAVTVIRGSTPTYAALTNDLVSAGKYFKAATCCSFYDRVMFGATRESDVPYPRRVRWSAVGDASLITAATSGAGALDLAEFSKPILRIRPLGDLVAVYSEDGVCFLRRTGQVTAPFTRQYVTTQRGLLAAQAVVSIGRNLHFGIFSDGWYTLGESGSWERIGVYNDAGGGGIRWDEVFYSTLNYAKRSQIAVGYDAYRQIVRISFPSGTSTTPNNLWNLDLKTNTVWPSPTGAFNPTYWSNGAQIYTSGAKTWADMTVSWSSVTGAWGDYAAKTEDIPAPIFGTNGGMVYQISYSNILQGYRVTSSTSSPISGGTFPSWYASSHRIPLAQIGSYSAPDTLWVNYQDMGSLGMVAGFVDTDGTQAVQSKMIGGISPNSSQSFFVNCHTVMKQVGWYVSGTGPVRLRGIRAQFLPTGEEQINQ